MPTRCSLVALLALALLPLPAGSNDSPATSDVRRPSGRVGFDPYDLVSDEVMLRYLEGLTAVRPFEGWRNSASIGEAEAIDYVAGEMRRMSNLVSWGLEIERQSFHTFSGTDFRQTEVHIEIDGVETQVPAFGVSGHRDELAAALLFDSDGVANDTEPDPVVVTGPPVVVEWEDDVFSLPNLEGRVVLLDYAVIDRITLGLDVASAHAEAIPQRPRSFRRGLVTNALSPHPYLFWITVGAPVVIRAGRSSLLAAALYIAGFYLLLIGSKIAVAFLVDRSKAWIQGRAYVWIIRSLGVVLLVFAVLFLRDGLRLLGVLAGGAGS